MEQAESAFIIIGMLFIVIFIGAVRRKTECVINFVLRMVFGMVFIYFANQAFRYFGMNITVAVNPVSILTSGFLGVPGIAVLYGVQFLVK